MFNKDKEPIGVFHKNLKRADGTRHRSVCPACEEGVLLIHRDVQHKDFLAAADNCINCGQRFVYMDIDGLNSAEILRKESDNIPLPPKYKQGERVKVSGWTCSDFGTVVQIKRTYHNRMGEYCWGYRCSYEGRGPGLTFLFVPEGYLRKLKPGTDEVIEDEVSKAIKKFNTGPFR